jgi:hypothetical protein
MCDPPWLPLFENREGYGTRRSLSQLHSRSEISAVISLPPGRVTALPALTITSVLHSMLYSYTSLCIMSLHDRFSGWDRAGEKFAAFHRLCDATSGRRSMPRRRARPIRRLRRSRGLVEGQSLRFWPGMTAIRGVRCTRCDLPKRYMCCMRFRRSPSEDELRRNQRWNLCGSG